MDLTKDILLFIELANSGSFQRCADIVGLSSSSVSRRMTKLEKSLDTQLIQRNKGSVLLTETGERLYQRCKFLEDSIESAINEIIGADNTIRGRLRVGISSSVIYHELFSCCLKDFQQENPEVEYDLEARDYHRYHGLDVYFTNEDKQDGQIISELLYKDQFLMCASPEYLEDKPALRTPTDLSHHTGIVHVGNPHIKNIWQVKLSQSNYVWTLKHENYSNRIDLIAELARTGLGIAILPRTMIETDIQENHLVVLLEEYFKSYDEIYVTYARTKPLEKKVKVFIDYLKAWPWGE